MNEYEFIIALATLISTCIVTPLMIYFLNKKQSAKVDVVEKKLDENHKQQNGNLTRLLKTTADLATANEKAKQEDKKAK